MRFVQESRTSAISLCSKVKHLFSQVTPARTDPREPYRRRQGLPVRTSVGLAIALATVFLTFSAGAVPAETDTRLDPRIRQLLAPGPVGGIDDALASAQTAGVPAIIRGEVNREDLEALGIIVGVEAGTILTADVPLHAFPALMDLPGVIEVEAARPLDLLLDVSSPEIEADECWGDTLSPYVPPYAGTTGAGVVLGIVDTGVDLDHQDFRDASGNTRILYLWDQTVTSNPPPGFSYGREWTAAQINAGTATEQDTDGHGTHVAGIAAGNGRATGNGYPAWRYVGIAPQADLIVVKSALSMESRVIDGVSYIFQKAGQLGKDAVVLLAFGTHRGAHDGSYSLDTAISALTGPGRLVVAAAGNDGLDPVHASVNPAVGQISTITFSIPTYTSSPSLLEFFEAVGWHEPAASFDVKLTTPTGYSTGWVAPGAYVYLPESTNGGIYLENAVSSSSSGAKKVRIYLSDTGYGYTPSPGTWVLEFKRLGGTQSGRLDAWVTDWTLPGAATPPRFTSSIEFAYLVRSPATGDSVLSVGAYTTKTVWTNGSGGQSAYPGAPPLGEIADFSSIGPRRDGVQSPDLCAPGYGVMSALSNEVTGGTSTTWRAEDGVHRIRKGTSMAAALVAGGIALALQEDPRLTPSAARMRLIDRAISDSWTGAVPNSSWGYGKARLPGAVSTAVPSGPPAESISQWAWPNPSWAEVTFHFSLSEAEASRMGEGPVLRIYDVQGREVSRLPVLTRTGPQALTWRGHTDSQRRAAPGIYFGRLDIGDGSRVWRITRLR